MSNKQSSPGQTPEAIEKEIEAIIEEAARLDISPEERDRLIDAIAKGNKAAIPVLVKGMEVFLYQMVATISEYHNYHDTDKLFEAAKRGLTRFAEAGLDKRRFYKFLGWRISQAILAVILKKNK